MMSWSVGEKGETCGGEGGWREIERGGGVVEKGERHYYHYFHLCLRLKYTLPPLSAHSDGQFRGKKTKEKWVREQQ